MKIELKNIKHHAALSEETNAFSASLYIDGKKVGVVDNTGKGGSSHIRYSKETKELVRAAEEYCKNLPARKVPIFNGETMDIPMRLDFLIDIMVEDDINYRPLKKSMKKSVLVKNGDKLYTYPVTTPVTKERMAAAIKALEEKGEKVLNNLPVKELLKEVYG